MFWPTPVITPRITTDFVIVTTDSSTASVIAKGNTHIPAVEVRPSSTAIAEAEPAEPNAT